MNRKLKRETLRHLTLSQMSRANGGTQASVYTDTCDSCYCPLPPELPPINVDPEYCNTIQAQSTNSRCESYACGR